MIGCIGCVFAALAEYSLILLLKFRHVNQIADNDCGLNTSQGKANRACFNKASASNIVEVRRTNSVQEGYRNVGGNDNETTSKKVSTILDRRYLDLGMIDCVSLIIFPTAFATFTIAYYLYFQV